MPIASCLPNPLICFSPMPHSAWHCILFYSSSLDIHVVSLLNGTDTSFVLGVPITQMLIYVNFSRRIPEKNLFPSFLKGDTHLHKAFLLCLSSLLDICQYLPFYVFHQKHILTWKLSLSLKLVILLTFSLLPAIGYWRLLSVISSHILKQVLYTFQDKSWFSLLGVP